MSAKLTSGPYLAKRFGVYPFKHVRQAFAVLSLVNTPRNILSRR
jgi:hypothetical protein